MRNRVSKIAFYNDCLKSVSVNPGNRDNTLSILIKGNSILVLIGISTLLFIYATTSAIFSIIFISSIAAVYSSPYSYAPYEISKSALIKLSETIARENAQFQIRCNSILPGMIDTPHAKQFINKKKT